MAKSYDVFITTSPPGSVSLAHKFNQLRLNGCFRGEALQRLAAWLPPTWHLELGPQDELLVVTPDGTHDGRHVFLRAGNPFEPHQPPPSVIAALYPDDVAPPSKSAAPSLSAAPSKPVTSSLIDTRVWLVKALKEHPQQQHEEKAAYARRLHELMLTAPVTRKWKWGSILRRLFD
jgi:hypothetical protein